MTERITGAMLGLACGDALGAPAEFMSQAQLQSRWGELTEMVGGGMWAPGEWTDDTGMALCVAEGILACPADPVEETGRRFLAWSRTAKDIGGTIRAALSGYRSAGLALGVGLLVAQSGDGPEMLDVEGAKRRAKADSALRDQGIVHTQAVAQLRFRVAVDGALAVLFGGPVELEPPGELAGCLHLPAIPATGQQLHHHQAWQSRPLVQ
jgi:hypothetical protein